MRSRRLFRSSLLLALAILVPLVSLNIPLAHATTPVFVNSVTLFSCKPSHTQCSMPALSVTSGNEIVVLVSGTSSLTSGVSDSQGNTYTNPFTCVANGNSRDILFITTAATTGSDTIHGSGASALVEMDALQYT